MSSFKEKYAIKRKIRKRKNKVKRNVIYPVITLITAITFIIYLSPCIISPILSLSSYNSNIQQQQQQHTSRNLLQGVHQPSQEPESKEAPEGYPPDALNLEQRKDGGWILYFLGMCYTFIGIALVCDEWFVPAIEVIVEKMDMTPDAAGATWMAAGGSAPELFTSFIGTFISRSNVGFGTIVGSAVFNVLFVIGCCAIFTPGHLPLTWWPFARDCCFYIMSLIVLAIFYGVITPDQIYWYEALLLFSLYIGYVTIMFNNQKLHGWFTRKFIKSKKKNTPNKDPNDIQLPDVSAGSGTGGKTDDTEFKDDGESYVFDAPSNIHFHASLFDFLTKDTTVKEIMGVHIVSRMKGECLDTFKSIDVDGNGVIDKDELKQVLFKLGEQVSSQDMVECFDEIDTDGNGEISFKEFENWYLKSKMKITTDVRKLFNQFDDNNDGHIDCEELKSLLESLNDDDNVEITDDLVNAAMSDLGKSSMNERISSSEFIEWYQSSSYFEQKQLRRQATLTTVEEKEDNDEGIEISFPEGYGKRIMFLITSPIMFSLYYTLPDVQKESRKHLWPITFSGSMIWLMVYSYLMVWMAVRIGEAWGVPDEVMGLTFLAAGTSVPDLLSSVIVAKMGEGDMAVSSSIGSNIFDILIGLPIPWLLYCISFGTNGEAKINVGSSSLFLSVVILIIMLLLVLLTIKLNKWKLTHQLGWTMFVLWILFVAQDLLRQFCDACNP